MTKIMVVSDENKQGYNLCYDRLENSPAGLVVRSLTRYSLFVFVIVLFFYLVFNSIHVFKNQTKQTG